MKSFVVGVFVNSSFGIIVTVFAQYTRYTLRISKNSLKLVKRMNLTLNGPLQNDKLIAHQTFPINKFMV